ESTPIRDFSRRRPLTVRIGAVCFRRTVRDTARVSKHPTVGCVEEANPVTLLTQKHVLANLIFVLCVRMKITTLGTTVKVTVTTRQTVSRPSILILRPTKSVTALIMIVTEK